MTHQRRPAPHVADFRTRGRSLFCALLAAVIVLVAAGCASRQYMNRGDAALAAGNPALAAHYFETALKLSPRRARDPDFMEKLHRARRDAAMAAARGAANRDQWDQAVAQLTRCLEVAPGFPPALELLPTARSKAAALHYHRALIAADHKRLDDARRELDEALRYDPESTAVRAAAASLAPNATAPALIEDAVHRGASLAAEKHWKAAAEELARAVHRVPTFLPARAGLARARREAAQAESFFQVGSEYARQGALDDAARALRRARDISPHDPQIKISLQAVERALHEVADRLGEAEAAMGRRDWDSGLLAVRKTRALYPADSRTRELERELRNRAARDFTTRGDAHLLQHRLRAAEKAYQHALAFLGDYLPAKKGSAAVQRALAAEADREQRREAAFLHAWKAETLHATPSGRRLLDATRRRIHVRLHVDLVLYVHNENRLRSADSVDLEAKLRETLRATLPPFIHLEDPAPRRADSPVYEARLSLISLEIQLDRVSEAHRVHAYTVLRSIPNPEIPKARASPTFAEKLDFWAKKRLFYGFF